MAVDVGVEPQTFADSSAEEDMQRYAQRLRQHIPKRLFQSAKRRVVEAAAVFAAQHLPNAGDMPRVFSRQSLAELLNCGNAERVVAAMAGFAHTSNPRVGLDDNMQPVSPVIDVDDESGN